MRIAPEPPARRIGSAVLQLALGIGAGLTVAGAGAFAVMGYQLGLPVVYLPAAGLALFVLAVTVLITRQPGA